MASRTRRARVVLAVVAMAVVGLGVWRGEAVYLGVTTKRYFKERTSSYDDVRFPSPPATRGWTRVRRWDNHPTMEALWYVETGYESANLAFDRNGYVQMTQFAPDGNVLRQMWQYGSGGTYRLKWTRFSPPWFWSVTDQTEPTIPAWMKDHAKWQAALDAQE